MYDAFLIVHGTDTMAYTASALSLMLPGFKKPIVLTGSQVSCAWTDRQYIYNVRALCA
jgi:L-asparaginase/Glu-tRNA(Gln) amidotransferase subunit D